MSSTTNVIKYSVDYMLRFIAVIAIANMLLISILVTIVDKESQPPQLVSEIGLPLSIILGLVLMIFCSIPGVIANKLNLKSELFWYVFRLPALIVTVVAIELFLLN